MNKPVTSYSTFRLKEKFTSLWLARRIVASAKHYQQLIVKGLIRKDATISILETVQDEGVSVVRNFLITLHLINCSENPNSSI